MNVEMCDEDFEEVVKTFCIPAEGLSFAAFLDRFGHCRGAARRSIVMTPPRAGVNICGASDAGWRTRKAVTDTQSESDNFSVYGDLSSEGSATPRTGKGSVLRWKGGLGTGVDHVSAKDGVSRRHRRVHPPSNPAGPPEPRRHFNRKV
jgi:hypothetical protein